MAKRREILLAKVERSYSLQWPLTSYSYDGSATPLFVIYARVRLPSQKASRKDSAKTLGILSTSVKLDPEATRFAHASAISDSRSRESGPRHFVWNHVARQKSNVSMDQLVHHRGWKTADFRAVTGNHSPGEPSPFSVLLLGTRSWRAQTERLWCSMADQSLLK